MYQEYFELYRTYTQKYGPKTAIFLLVGSFYELYELQNIETGETRCNVKELVDILGCQPSIKRNIEPGYDGLVAGFPDYTMHKWAGRLTSAGWTVVIVDQIKDSRGKVVERKPSRILSPSTHIENASQSDTPYIVTLYFVQNQTAVAPKFGVGALDLTTGRTSTYSGVANGRQDIWTADDLVQLLSVFQPKELLIYWWYGSINSIVPDEAFFRRIFGVERSVPIHIRSLETNGPFSKALVRSEYLQMIYSVKSLLPVNTYLGLRSEQEELALMYLLQFVEEHYPSMLKSFHRNMSWIPEAHLICGNHALTQLQMTGPNQNETIVGIFNKSITAMGKRAIRDRLLKPYSDANEISQRLKEVQEYLLWSEEKTKILERQLRFMCDLSRLHRKVLCGLITPQEIVGLFQTYSAIQVIISQVTNVNSLLKEPFTQSRWLEYLKVFRENFTEEKAQRVQQTNRDITAFNIEKYTEIGQKEKEIQEVLNTFQSLRREIAQKGGVAEDAIRLEEREKEPYGMKGSTITLQQLKKNKELLPEGIKISELKSGGWIDCLKLQQLNTKLQKLREGLENLVRIYLADACLEISEVGQQIWTSMEMWICHIDCTQCIGRISKEYGLICPTIESVNENGSGVDIKNIRHPLVEAASSRVSYVKHNINLGYCNEHIPTKQATTTQATTTQMPNGWLVYGMNASGKSTLMKATGVCILLAQAGCFVPAKEMTLRPFKAIYTRILNQDNLFAGLSSFAVEMSELRDILRNADKYTCVLGDELCSGTESTSAQALVASGIQWLSARNSKFIFATHLHNLPNIIDTKELKVEVWHLHVEYNPVTKKLIYDRSLRSGSGSTLYGLEVARAMDLPFEFIEQALKNRNTIIGSTTQMDAMSSSWNSNIIKKECEICHKQIVNELEVHHIKPRASAVNNILEDGSHMNDKRNLIVICEKCHDKVHAEIYDIGEMTLTSDGPERDITNREITQSCNEKTIKSKGKWTEGELEIIVDTLKKYSALSLKSIRAHLNSKYAIDISETVLRKMKKGL